MKKGEKTLRTQQIERIAEFFMLEHDSIYKKLKEETKTSNMHVKKAYSNLCNGLPYYDMNAILYEVCKVACGCRFILQWEISQNKQGIECWYQGKQYLTKTSGIEGINSILNQIGFKGKRLNEPKNFIELVIWK